MITNAEKLECFDWLISYLTINKDEININIKNERWIYDNLTDYYYSQPNPEFVKHYYTLTRILYEGKGVLIEELQLSSYAKNCLLRQGIITLFQLCKYKASELLKMRNIGEATLTDIIVEARKHGFELVSE